MAYGKKFDLGGMRDRRGDGDVGMREFERERGNGVGDADRNHGGGRTGDELHRDGRRIRDGNGCMDVHVCLYAFANDRGAESGADKTGAVYFGRDGERRKYRDLDDKFN